MILSAMLNSFCLLDYILVSIVVPLNRNLKKVKIGYFMWYMPITYLLFMLKIRSFLSNDAELYIFYVYIMY